MRCTIGTHERAICMHMRSICAGCFHSSVINSWTRGPTVNVAQNINVRASRYSVLAFDIFRQCWTHDCAGAPIIFIVILFNRPECSSNMIMYRNPPNSSVQITINPRTWSTYLFVIANFGTISNAMDLLPLRTLAYETCECFFFAFKL